MNKAELIDAMAAGSGLTKSDVKRALDAFIGATTSALIKGEKVSLVGFGAFSVHNRAARDGRNPKWKPGMPGNGKIRVPAKKVVKFKTGSDLSSSVN